MLMQKDIGYKSAWFVFIVDTITPFKGRVTCLLHEANGCVYSQQLTVEFGVFNGTTKCFPEGGVFVSQSICHGVAHTSVLDDCSKSGNPMVPVESTYSYSRIPSGLRIIIRTLDLTHNTKNVFVLLI